MRIGAALWASVNRIFGKRLLLDWGRFERSSASTEAARVPDGRMALRKSTAPYACLPAQCAAMETVHGFKVNV
jgi:hypothetical protein